LNAELNPICHLLALLGGATIVVVSRLRVNLQTAFFPYGSTAPSGPGPPQSFSARVISLSQGPTPEKTRHSQKTDIYSIRTRSPSKQAAADPCLRPRGYWGIGLHTI